MEQFVQYKDKARRNIKVADHMLTMTYPLVKDPKVLLGVLENLFMAVTNSITSVLHYEKLHKRIPSFSDTFDSKFSTFKTKVVPRYGIDLKWVRFIVELREAVQEHQEATTEFPRKGKYVMADKDYRLKTLDEALLKDYLKKAKELVHELLQLVSKQ